MKTIYITILSILWATLSFAQNTVSYQYDNEGRIIHSDDGTKVQQYQYDNLGNRTSYTITSTVDINIDLTVNTINIPNTNIVQGQSYAVSCTVQNLGTTEATNGVLKVYLSPNTTGTEMLVGTHTISSISANGSENASFNINIPSSATIGNQHLVFFIDAVESITETDETNNKDNIAVIVSEPALAELNIQNTGLSATNVQAGNSLDLTANVYNDGTITANNFTVKSYLSNNATFEANDMLLSGTTENITSLSANNNVAYSKTALIPSNTIAGNYYILFVVDSGNTVTEIDETNNVSAVSLIVTNTSTAPVAEFVANNTNISVDGTVQFIDQSTNNPTSWLWTFEGGTPSTSTQQNPQITYDALGTFDVTLVATNSNGNSTELKNDYITVGDCAGEWDYLGLPSFSSGVSSKQEIVIDSNRIPYVAFKDANNSNKVTVMKYENTIWTIVGNAGLSHVGTDDLDLAISNNDEIYVLYTDASNSYKISVKKFNGSTWINVGLPNFTNGNSGRPRLAIDETGIPYIAYQDQSVNYKLTVMKYDGSWVNVGSPGISANWAYSQSLIVNETDRPYIAYQDDSESDKLTVKKFNGSVWGTIGNIGFSSAKAEFIDIKLDSYNSPYVAYKDWGNNLKKTTVKKFNGSNWITVGIPNFSPDGQTWYQKLLISTENLIYVSFRYDSNGTAVMKYDGASWVSVGSSDVISTPTGYETIAMDNENSLYLAYADGAEQKTSVIKFACNESIETDFYASQTISTTGSVITFTDASTNTPTTWFWSFSPSTVAYVNGTSSTSQNPEVTFDALGLYSVTLNSSNASSSDTETKTDYINITVPMTYVPDDNFEQALIDLGYDDVIDDYVITDNINTIQSLNVSSKSINDLTGIQDFFSLESLNCQNNSISSLNMTNNTSLISLTCFNNQISVLDVSNNSELIYLGCYNNNLTSLNLSQNPILEGVLAFGNPISSLDVSQNPLLKTFKFGNSTISSIDLSSNPNLEVLSFLYTQISELDISNNPLIHELVCGDSELVSLDLRQIPNLIYLFCGGNNLTYLDIRNSSNSAIINDYFNTSNNPNLNCIYVDDAVWSTANWTNIDVTSTFVETEAECTALGIEDEFLSQNIKIYPNPTSSILNIETSNNIVIENMKVYDITGKLLNNYKGNPQSISVKDYANGVYFINIQTKKGKVVMKIVKQ